jgi:plastocyanin
MIRGPGSHALLVPLAPHAVAGVLALALLTAPGNPALATTVTGVVTRAPAPAPRTAGPDRYRGRAASPEEESRPTSVPCACNPGEFSVVWLTGANLPRPTLPAKPPTMSQKDRLFVPAVLAIPVGATVEFPNEDPFFHNVFSYSKVRSFDLGRYPKGESHGVRFDEPGIIPIFCEIHYSMRAYIHVLETPYFAVSDVHGKFAIENVAPGDYEIHAWQENLPEIVRPVQIGNEAAHIELP